MQLSVSFSSIYSEVVRDLKQCFWIFCVWFSGLSCVDLQTLLSAAQACRTFTILISTSLLLSPSAVTALPRYVNSSASSTGKWSRAVMFIIDCHVKQFIFEEIFFFFLETLKVAPSHSGPLSIGLFNIMASSPLNRIQDLCVYSNHGAATFV